MATYACFRFAVRSNKPSGLISNFCILAMNNVTKSQVKIMQLALLKSEFPKSEGWDAHTVIVVEVSKEYLKKFIEFARPQKEIAEQDALDGQS